MLPYIESTERTRPLFQAIYAHEQKGMGFVEALTKVIDDSPELFETARLDMPGDFAERLLASLGAATESGRVHGAPLHLHRDPAEGHPMKSETQTIHEEAMRLSASGEVSYLDALMQIRAKDPARFSAARGETPVRRGVPLALGREDDDPQARFQAGLAYWTKRQPERR
jgi:hypothetical protein